MLNIKNQMALIITLKDNVGRQTLGIKRFSDKIRIENFLELNKSYGGLTFTGAMVIRSRVNVGGEIVVKDLIEGYVFECRNCKKFGSVVSRQELREYIGHIEENKCPYCKGIDKNAAVKAPDKCKKDEVSRASKYESEAEEIMENKKEIIKLMNNTIYKDEFSQGKNPVNADSRYGTFVIDKIKDWTAGEKCSATRFSSEISKRNNNLVPMNIDRITDEDGNMQVSIAQCICKQCGELVPVKYEDRNKKIICPGCAKKISGHINYLGRYKRSYIGIVKNGLMAIKQNINKSNGDIDGTMVTVECIDCGRIIEDLNAYIFLNGLTYCGCEKSDEKVVCPKCGRSKKIAKDLILDPNRKSSIVKCIGCSSDIISFDNLAKKSLRRDAEITLKGKWDKADKLGKSIVATDNGIIRSTKIQYVSTKGEPYYKCYCMECDREFTLNSEEISSFTHEDFCLDNRYEPGDMGYPSINSKEEISL